MKKVAIVTLQDFNYGNRLQNFALSCYLSNFVTCKTLHVSKSKVTFWGKLKAWVHAVKNRTTVDLFEAFNRRIPYYKRVVLLSDEQNKKLVNEFDYFIAGSDQIWNTNFNSVGDREFLTFAKSKQKIAYAASIGLDTLPEDQIDRFIESLSDFSAISMREKAGAKIVEELFDRKISVVIDPTMLLTVNEWRKISFKSNFQLKKTYILKYTLGIENPQYDNWIENFAVKNNLEVFELKDGHIQESLAIGPIEFISLIDNATYVVTDSFHGGVFSILFNKPFIIVERDCQPGYGKMSSRLDTLLETFKLIDRRARNVDELETIEYNCDFTHVQKILDEEKKKAIAYLKTALRI